ncbi:hypothetical protein GCM10023086_75680 [Streptomyces venetus]|uniref:DUF4158 domain-containing protein n=1 Tax=Streptomyces venetus TaxID=1701086 RepID=A0ABP8HJV8_9ACTN
MREGLAGWLDARAWTTGDGPKELFDAAAGWLREGRVLLPGASRLARLVGSVREAANQRLWERPVRDAEHRAAGDAGFPDASTRRRPLRCPARGLSRVRPGRVQSTDEWLPMSHRPRIRPANRPGARWEA